jgi:hypothetical protein
MATNFLDKFLPKLMGRQRRDGRRSFIGFSRDLLVKNTLISQREGEKGPENGFYRLRGFKTGLLIQIHQLFGDTVFVSW